MDIARPLVGMVVAVLVGDIVTGIIDHVRVGIALASDTQRR